MSILKYVFCVVGAVIIHDSHKMFKQSLAIGIGVLVRSRRALGAQRPNCGARDRARASAHPADGQTYPIPPGPAAPGPFLKNTLNTGCLRRPEHKNDTSNMRAGESTETLSP